MNDFSLKLRHAWRHRRHDATPRRDVAAGLWLLPAVATRRDVAARRDARAEVAS